MSKVQMLRSLVKQRLTAAAEEIFGLFERTIAEYEEELCRSKEENERQRKLMDAVFNPQLRLHRADVQQLSVVKEEVPPEQQEWSSSVDQEDPEPPHIKGEQEELWISQEGEQLQGLEEADITKFISTPVPVKSEDDEEKPQSSQLHQRHTEQMETEAEEEGCGVPEPAGNSDPDTHLQPETDDKTGASSEPETDDSDDWKETREPQSGLNSLKNDEVSVSDLIAGEKPFRCSECGKRFGRNHHLKDHMRSHTGKKPFNCSECGKLFSRSGVLKIHMRSHTGEKPINCSECGERFRHSGILNTHMRSHTGEKPFSCSDCGKQFCHSGGLKIHMRSHTGDKPFRCSECGKGFSHSGALKIHMKCHTGEKPFCCPECGRGFRERGNLKIHMRSHTGEKPFSCSECGKSFRQSQHLKKHMKCHAVEKPFSCYKCGERFDDSGVLKVHLMCHTGEKPFSCSICGMSFSQSGNFLGHMRTHEGEK
ncbi:gastrula zinc finger protein XlCGF57.1-like [Epinephelus moara]|uniref:gastrula zinc finger protein XlCGF57.1-like n=1 Tax=Epinephelus moara TaxID=300413 RepID=UPI00214E339E|nr:gastrula zinc finger protein XlCGF57.1-like [Epinephelus moara]